MRSLSNLARISATDWILWDRCFPLIHSDRKWHSWDFIYLCLCLQRYILLFVAQKLRWGWLWMRSLLGGWFLSQVGKWAQALVPVYKVFVLSFLTCCPLDGLLLKRHHHFWRQPENRATVAYSTVRPLLFSLDILLEVAISSASCIVSTLRRGVSARKTIQSGSI